MKHLSDAISTIAFLAFVAFIFYLSYESDQRDKERQADEAWARKLQHDMDSMRLEVLPRDTVGVVMHGDSLWNVVYPFDGVRDSSFIGTVRGEKKISTK